MEVIKDPIIAPKGYRIGTIYCYVNNIDNKMYIGKTIQRRWLDRICQHRCSIGNCYHLHRALAKYGEDSFSINVLYQTKMLENNEENTQLLEQEICEKEKYYISLYQTTDPQKGYNITIGGDGISGYKFSEESKQKMSESRKGSKHWNYGKHNSAGKKIVQYDLDGNKVKEYLSLSDAARELKCSSSVISNALNKRIFTAFQYIWKYIDEDPPTKEECYWIKNKDSILCYDAEGKLFKKFINTKEATEYFHCDRSLIQGACNGKFTHAKFYVFIHEREFSETLLNKKIEQLQKAKDAIVKAYKDISQANYKPVLQYDLKDNLIKEWDSPTIAANTLHCGRSGIYACCRGEQKTTHGYKWKYKDM